MHGLEARSTKLTASLAWHHTKSDAGVVTHQMMWVFWWAVRNECRVLTHHRFFGSTRSDDISCVWGTSGFNCSLIGISQCKMRQKWELEFPASDCLDMDGHLIEAVFTAMKDEADSFATFVWVLRTKEEWVFGFQFLQCELIGWNVSCLFYKFNEVLLSGNVEGVLLQKSFVVRFLREPIQMPCVVCMFHPQISFVQFCFAIAYFKNQWTWLTPSGCNWKMLFWDQCRPHDDVWSPRYQVNMMLFTLWIFPWTSFIIHPPHQRPVQCRPAECRSTRSRLIDWTTATSDSNPLSPLVWSLACVPLLRHQEWSGVLLSRWNDQMFLIDQN